MKYKLTIAKADNCGKILRTLREAVLETTSYEKALGAAYDMSFKSAGNFVKCEEIEDGNFDYHVYTNYNVSCFNPKVNKFEEKVNGIGITIKANSQEEALDIYKNNFLGKTFFPDNLMSHGEVVDSEGYATWMQPLGCYAA